MSHSCRNDSDRSATDEEDANTGSCSWPSQRVGTCRLNPIARVLLAGLYDEQSNFSKLLGTPHILRLIWSYIIEYWKRHIKVMNPKIRSGLEKHGLMFWLEAEDFPGEGVMSFTKVGPILDDDSYLQLKFPTPSDININMMPMVMGNTFAECLLPSYIEPYWEIIQNCSLPESEIGKIGYLTIHESFVHENTSQRRPGIHTESPGRVAFNDDSLGCQSAVKGHGISRFDHIGFYWGRGYCGGSQEKLDGGIYMVSNVENSCQVWDCQIMKPENGQEIIGELGDIEHLRSFLPPHNEIMEKNIMYWLTDRTPHESLPLKEGTYRQYFRLVTSEVSIWYEDHSTANPLGVVPDPEVTLIVKGSKFDKNGVYVKE